MTEKEEQLPPLEVPLDGLSADAIDGIIDNFIQREGTDYGVQEINYDTKMQQVRKQIQKGDVKIVFDPNTESVTLMTAREWARWQQH